MKSGSKKTYTILLFSNSADAPKKFVVPSSLVYCVGIIGAILIVFGTSVLVDYTQLLFEKNQAHWLRTENRFLKEQFKEIEGQLVALENSLERVDSFSRKLRLITNIGAPDRELELSVPINPIGTEDMKTVQGRWPANIGPIEGFFDKQEYKSPPSNGELSVAMKSDYSQIAVRMENVIKGTDLKEKDVLQLWKELSDKNDILLSTPSIRPALGWITSNFGTRSSPFSGDTSLHKGLDIAADNGTPIRAPASGVVSFVGFDEGYGKSVSIDHGHGIVTRFAHCSQLYTKIGQRVRRGDVLAAVGNTGRSTGPHLHYEVRLNGVPVNPEKYILE